MFVGELSCLVVYFGVYYFRRRLWLKRNVIRESGQIFELDDELNEEPLIPKFNIFIFLPPAFCDVIASSLMYISLNLTTASSFQMLRGDFGKLFWNIKFILGAVIIFTGLLSVAFLRSRLQGYKWLGMGFVTIGLVIVGLSDILFNENSKDDINAIITGYFKLIFFIIIILGDLLIIMAQIIVAIQMVTEQKFVLKYDVPPLLAVGLEGFLVILKKNFCFLGFFGLLIISIAIIPMYFIHVSATFSKNPDHRLENVFYAFYEIYVKPEVGVALLCTIIRFKLFYNTRYNLI